MSQRNLKRFDQVSKMISDLREGCVLPTIELSRDEDGELQLEDGHHRLTAIYLSGRKILHEDEYFVVEKDRYRSRCGKIQDLINYCKF